MSRKHSVCRWSFGPGKGGFLPGNVRPAWAPDRFDTAQAVHLVNEQIRSRIPTSVQLGFEAHVDTEVCEDTAAEVANALQETGIALAMITPGAHSHFAYGGLASLDPSERQAAGTLGTRTLELAYGPLRAAWDPKTPPTFVIWNGSWGYDMVSPHIRGMLAHLVQGLADLVNQDQHHGGELYFGIEPKPNEGHPAMLAPTVASAILLWKKVSELCKTDPHRHGINMEIGHSEMVGLDPVHDVAEQLEHVRALYDEICHHYGLRVGLRNARKHLGWALDVAARCGQAPSAKLKGWRQHILTSEEPNKVHRALGEAFDDLAWSAAA